MRYLLFSMLLVAGTAYAQEGVEVTSHPLSAYDSARSIHIKSYPDHFFIWPVIKRRQLDFTITDRPDQTKSLNYRSNQPTAAGVGVYLFELGVELAFALPLSDRQKQIYGESDARDLQLNIFTKKWGLDTYYQKYEGFYVVDPDVEVPVNVPFPQRLDVTTRNLGVTGNYVFNNKKFSFRSAYNFAERQLHSSGSFLLLGTINSFRARGDSAILDESYRGAFGNDVLIREIKTTALGIAPGYTYSLIHKGFFINATLALGPAHNWLSHTSEDGLTEHDIEFTAFFAARVAVGYNGDHFFGGLSFVSQTHRARFETVELTSSTGAFKMVLGFRFKEFGVLRYRVGDLPKALGL